MSPSVTLNQPVSPVAGPSTDLDQTLSLESSHGSRQRPASTANAGPEKAGCNRLASCGEDCEQGLLERALVLGQLDATRRDAKFSDGESGQLPRPGAATVHHLSQLAEGPVGIAQEGLHYSTVADVGNQRVTSVHVRTTELRVIPWVQPARRSSQHVTQRWSLASCARSTMTPSCYFTRVVVSSMSTVCAAGRSDSDSTVGTAGRFSQYVVKR